MSTFIADTHVHIYPAFDAVEQLTSAYAALVRADGGMAVSADDVHVGLFLAERHDCHVYRDWQIGKGIPSGLHVSPSPEEGALVVAGQEGWKVFLVAGRQLVTAERLEILALTVDAEIPDGLPFDKARARILELGGVPVLPWSPGKWMLRRRPVVKHLLQQGDPGAMAVGDSAMRPRGWGEPALMKLARGLGYPILAGTDPLPVPGGDAVTGTYGISIPAGFEPDHPVTSARRLLLNAAARIAIIGVRETPLQVHKRMRHLKKARGQDVEA